jgi:hypothetical protein
MSLSHGEHSGLTCIYLLVPDSNCVSLISHKALHIDICMFYKLIDCCLVSNEMYFSYSHEQV